MPEFVGKYFARIRIVPDCDPTTTCDTNALLQLVVNVLQLLVDIAVTVAVISVMWGGFLMLTSGGSSTRISNGKKAITYAVIGVVIVTVATFLISMFIELFTNCEVNWLDFGHALVC